MADAVLCWDHENSDRKTGAVHACGHDAQVTAMLGAAIGLGLGAADHGRNVVFRRAGKGGWNTVKACGNRARSSSSAESRVRPPRAFMTDIAGMIRSGGLSG